MPQAALAVQGVRGLSRKAGARGGGGGGAALPHSLGVAALDHRCSHSLPRNACTTAVAVQHACMHTQAPPPACLGAVRGAIALKSSAYQQQLKEGKGGLPFDKVYQCNIGNPQILGQASTRCHMLPLWLMVAARCAHASLPPTAALHCGPPRRSP